jgi:Ca2+-binding EF-hand superfamily protein
MLPLVVNQQNNPEELNRLFGILDVDGNQKITYENLRTIAVQAGEKVPEEDLHAIIAEADLDKDGGLNFREFQALMTQDAMPR